MSKPSCSGCIGCANSDPFFSILKEKDYVMAQVQMPSNLISLNKVLLRDNELMIFGEQVQQRESEEYLKIVRIPAEILMENVRAVFDGESLVVRFRRKRA